MLLPAKQLREPTRITGQKFHDPNLDGLLSGDRQLEPRVGFMRITSVGIRHIQPVRHGDTQNVLPLHGARLTSTEFKPQIPL